MNATRRALAAAAIAAAAALIPASVAGAAPRVLLVTDGATAPPPGSRLVTKIGGTLDTWSTPVPAGTDPLTFSDRVRQAPGVVATQVDTPIHMAQNQQPGFCATAKPTDVDRIVAKAVNSALIDPVPTKPIAVLDTGLGADVPEIPADRIVSPYNALDGSTDATDLDGHGTQVAGVAAGKPGFYEGVSQQSPVMPIKIFNQSGDSSAQALVKGIQPAVSAGAGVINIRGAGPASDVSAGDAEVVDLALQNAFGPGVVTVVSAANEGSNKPYVPGNFPHVLTVGSGTGVGGRSTFSNIGPWIDLVSPGESLNPPMPPAICDTGYGPANGTSFAAPAVAGAVALIQTLKPNLTTQQLVDTIRESTLDVSPDGRDDDTGFGLLDVQGAMDLKTPKSDGRELDDDVFWLKGAYAANHPQLLNKGRVSRVAARVGSAKDPTDVWPIKLRKNQSVTARVTGAASDALLDVSIWDSKTGNFDISNDKETHQIAGTAGFSSGPEVTATADRGGTYYVAVDTVDPGDVDTDGEDAATVKLKEDTS